MVICIAMISPLYSQSQSTAAGVNLSGFVDTYYSYNFANPGDQFHGWDCSTSLDWMPDLVKSETRFIAALLVRF